MMKRIITLILCLLMIFSFAGCNKTKDNGDSSEPAVSETEFKQPENYEIKLLISINPKFTAYLDKDGAVLAVDFMNDDAKSLKSEVKSSNCNIEDLISSIISSAKKKNYFGDKPKISIDLLEFTCATAESDGVLIAANASAMENGKSFGLTVEILRNGKIFAINGELSSDNPTTSNPDTTSSETITPSTTTSSTPTHTHTFSKATCTAAAKCSCGATSGSAIGHSWQAATCKAPRACKTCGVTEGSVADHNYVNGKCSVCNDSQYINPKTNLKLDALYRGNFSVIVEPMGRTLYGWGLYTSSDPANNILYADNYFPTYESGKEKITFKGETFYHGGGGPVHMSNIIITDTEIIAGTSFSDDTPYVKFSMLKNGRLIVTYSKHGNYPVGMQLSADENEFLTVE